MADPTTLLEKPDQYQYIKLPDGSYGKFAHDATDDFIRQSITKDFPHAFTSVQSPIAPPSVPRPDPGMHQSYLMGPANETPHDFSPWEAGRDIEHQALDPIRHSAATLLKAGPQAMAHGILKKDIFGTPPSTNEMVNAGLNVGGVMAGEMVKGGEPSLQSTRPTRAASESEPIASRLVRSSNRTSGAGAGAAPGGFGEFTSDLGEIFKPKSLKVAQFAHKWGSRIFGGDYAAAEPVQSGHPLAQPEVAPKGFEPGATKAQPYAADDMSHQGVPYRPRPTAGAPGVPEAPSPTGAARLLKAAPGRPTPAWKMNEITAEPSPSRTSFSGHDFSADTEGMNRAKAELAEGKIQRSELLQRAQYHKEQIKGAGMSGATPATEVRTPAQVTPQTSAGDTFSHVSKEHSAIDAKDGGQMGHPTAVGRLAKAPSKLVGGTPIPKRFPMTGKTAVGDINPHPRQYYPENPESVNDIVNRISGEKRSPIWKLQRNNASGESSASLEAINRTKSESTRGIKRYRIDTRSGNESPLIGTDAVDAQAGPHDIIVERGPHGETELDRGKFARGRKR